MDPLTQAVVGGVAAQACAAIARRDPAPRPLARAGVVGALAGMAPDLDVLIRSEADPLLALEFHRHFTHSLLFIPFGALICALLFYLPARRLASLTRAEVYVWCLLGYGSHGLLDACTSYGTQLLWPLSNRRFAWDWVSVVDPLFTLPLLTLVLLAAFRPRRRWVALALVWGVAYLGAGAVQHHRALELGEQLAARRGLTPVRLEAKPSFGNLLVWKVVTEADGHFYVDAVKPGPGGGRVWPGDRIPRLNIPRDLPWLDTDSRQARDIERFRWFSADYLALEAGDTTHLGDPGHPTRVVDIRYSLLPDQIKPLWGISLDRDADRDAHARYYTDRGDGRQALSHLWRMIRE